MTMEAIEGARPAVREEERPARSSGAGVLRRSLPLLRPHWRRACELLVYMGFDLVFSLAIPLSSRYLFDEIIAPRAVGRLGVWLAVVLAIFAVGSFASYRRV